MSLPVQIPSHFPWQITGQVLRQVLQTWELQPADKGRFCAQHGEGESATLSPPLVLAPTDGIDAETYLAQLPEELGTQIVCLLRAGSAALGMWRGEDLYAHKAIRKYVVRGKGHAQPTHLSTKGKSRYGSRLRLRNAESLLADCNERLHQWAYEPDFERIFLAAPVRTRAALFAVKPAPPFSADDPRLQRIPFHTHEPRHEELLRVRRLLTRGTWQEDQ